MLDQNITMFADGRDRAPNKSMARGQYFGNFSNVCGMTVSLSDLLSLAPESAGRIALAIRSNLGCQLSPRAIAQRIAFFEDPRYTHPPGRIAWAADIIPNNWCRFDTQCPQLDFG